MYTVAFSTWCVDAIVARLTPSIIPRLPIDVNRKPFARGAHRLNYATRRQIASFEICRAKSQFDAISVHTLTEPLSEKERGGDGEKDYQ